MSLHLQRAAKERVRDERKVSLRKIKIKPSKNTVFKMRKERKKGGQPTQIERNVREKKLRAQSFECADRAHAFDR